MKIKFSNIFILIVLAFMLFMGFGLIGSSLNIIDFITPPSMTDSTVTDSIVTEPEVKDLINFTFYDSETYHYLVAEDCMSWGEWVESEYNTIGITNGNCDGDWVGTIYYGVSPVTYSDQPVRSDDDIKLNGYYELN